MPETSQKTSIFKNALSIARVSFEKQLFPHSLLRWQTTSCHLRKDQQIWFIGLFLTGNVWPFFSLCLTALSRTLPWNKPHTLLWYKRHQQSFSISFQRFRPSFIIQNSEFTLIFYIVFLKFFNCFWPTLAQYDGLVSV